MKIKMNNIVMSISLIGLIFSIFQITSESSIADGFFDNIIKNDLEGMIILIIVSLFFFFCGLKANINNTYDDKKRGDKK